MLGQHWHANVDVSVVAPLKDHLSNRAANTAQTRLPREIDGDLFTTELMSMERWLACFVYKEFCIAAMEWTGECTE
jgi:hypothetical protein